MRPSLSVRVAYIFPTVKYFHFYMNHLRRLVNNHQSTRTKATCLIVSVAFGCQPEQDHTVAYL